MLKKLKLLKDWDAFKKDSIIEVDAEVAKALIASQTAEDHKEEAAEQPDANVQAMVEKGITEALKEYSKTNKSFQIQVTKCESEQGFANIGEQLMAVKEFATKGVMHKKLDAIIQKAAGGASGGSIAIDSDGGFLVQQDIEQELFQVLAETGVLARRCQNTTIGANANGLTWNAIDEKSRVNGSRKGGISVYRAAEADTYTSSKPKFAKRQMNLEKMIGLYYATDELLSDATALGSEISSWFGDEFGFMTDYEILRGTGVSQMLGILNAGCLVTVNKETGQAASTIVAKNVINMFSRLHAGSIGKSEWFINQDCLPQLMQMAVVVGTGGQLIYMPPGGLSSAPYGTLLGRPVNAIEQCSTVGTVGDIIFADFSQYKMISKDGVKADSSIHVRFLQGEQAFRFSIRNNGQPKWQTALTPNQGSNTQSPFIALQTRS